MVDVVVVIDAVSHADSSSSSVDHGDSNGLWNCGTAGTEGVSAGACGDRDRVVWRRVGGGSSCRSKGDTVRSNEGTCWCGSSADVAEWDGEAGRRGTEGDGGTRDSWWKVAAEETEDSDPGEAETTSASGTDSSTQTLRSRGRPRPSSSRPASTAARHWTRSLRTVSRRDNVRSFRFRKSGSRELGTDEILSRVLTRSNPVVLLSLRMAAASRSGQSDRLTNSNWAWPTWSTDAPTRRLEVDDSGRGRSKASTSLFSWDGLGAVSLKRSKDAATFRPMPAAEVDGTARSGLEEEDAEERGDGVRRDKARRAVTGETVRKMSDFFDVREDGMVRALSEARRKARW